MSQALRSACARRIQALRERTAQVVTEAFLERHPDWLARYGERARVLGNQDAVFHIDFLTGAIEAGAPEAFADYAVWTAGVLGARGIGPESLVENLRQIEQVLCAEMADCRDLIASMVDAACTACVAAPADAKSGGLAGPLDPVQRLFTAAALRGDRQAATGIALEVLRGGHTVEALYTQVFETSQYAVGALWQTNRISVVDEHVATAVTQYVMARVFDAVTLPSTPMRGMAVIAGVEGELHQIGANMVADILAADGWDVQFLGTNVPHRDLVRTVTAQPPALLGLSTTMLFHVPKVGALITDIRAALGLRAPKILLGGAAFRLAPDAVSSLGADGYAKDLTSVRGLVNSLLA